MTSPTYWEKTVEYKFILLAAKDGQIDFIAPLAGVQERAAGDAIFGAEDRLFLVEFKVDADQLDTEVSLFKDYEAAEEALGREDGHHFLVYASNAPVGGEPFPPLTAQTYFSRETLASPLRCFDRGIDQDSFRDYAAALFEHKHADGRSSSGQISPNGLANVVGINPASKTVLTVTLYEYAKTMFPELVFANQKVAEQKLSNSYSPGPGW